MNPLTIIKVTGYIEILNAILRNWSSKSFSFPLAWLAWFKVLEMNNALEVALLRRKIDTIVYLVSNTPLDGQEYTDQGNGNGCNDTWEKLPEVLPISPIVHHRTIILTRSSMRWRNLWDSLSVISVSRSAKMSKIHTSCNPTSYQLLSLPSKVRGWRTMCLKPHHARNDQVQ